MWQINYSNVTNTGSSVTHITHGKSNVTNNERVSQTLVMLKATSVIVIQKMLKSLGPFDREHDSEITRLPKPNEIYLDCIINRNNTSMTS